MFVEFTYATGVALVNVNHISAIVQHDGVIYLKLGETTEPLIITESIESVKLKLNMT